MDTKKLVVELTKDIKEAKLSQKNKHNKYKNVSLSEQAKINAVYKFLMQNFTLSAPEFEEILKKRPILFRYYRKLLKKYPDFALTIRSADPTYYLLRENGANQFKNI